LTVSSLKKSLENNPPPNLSARCGFYSEIAQSFEKAKGKREKAKVKREKAKGERQKVKGKR
jgi:hypothetical protein